MPAGAAGRGEMESAPFRPAALDVPGDRDQRGSDIGGGGRTAALVRDDAQDRPLGPEPQHGFHEICSICPVHPGGPQDDVVRRRRPHGALGGFLAAPIDIERVDGIRLAVGLALAPVEHVIGRQVNQRRRVLAAYRSDMSSSRAIDRPSRFGLAFGAVDRGISGEIDDQIGAFPSDRGAYGRCLGDVGRVPIERYELEPCGPSCAANLAADLPSRPEHQNPHRRLLRGHLVSSSGVRAEQLVEVVDGTG